MNIDNKKESKTVTTDHLGDLLFKHEKVKDDFFIGIVDNNNNNIEWEKVTELLYYELLKRYSK